MESSRYNYGFYGLGKEPLICNGLSGAIIAKPAFSLTSTRIPKAIQTFLHDHQFICREGEDELSWFLSCKKSITEAPQRLDLTIALHSECNFRCTYCFQNFKKQKFEASLQDQLVAFVDKRLPQGGILNVHYYGGEPLLAWKELTNLNEEFERLMATKGGAYHFFVTSNGSLLRSAYADYFAKKNIFHIKVTLDGPPRIHDKRRVRAGGGPTFKKITENLKHALKSIKIVVRVNLDADNICHVSELLDMIKEIEPSSSNNIRIDYNIVYEPNSGSLINSITYQDIYVTQIMTLDKRLQLFLPPLTRIRHCKFNSRNAFLVSSDGGFYVCSESDQFKAGDLRTMMDLNQDTLPLGMKQQFVNFYSLRKVCLNCKLLPICGGGCSLLAVNHEKPPCPVWKDSYRDYLQVQHLNTLVGQQVNNESITI